MKISLCNNSNKILYLPIEVFTREFHSKIYLAHEAVQQGWTVLIGPKYDINPMMKYLPVGIYSGIGFHKSAAKLAKKVKERHEIVLAFLIKLGVDDSNAAIDSEGIEHHVSSTTLAAMKRFLKK